MDLKEFVQNTVQQIAAGLAGAQQTETLKNNPNPPTCKDVQFDVFLVADATGIYLANDTKTGTHVTFKVTLEKE